MRVLIAVGSFLLMCAWGSAFAQSPPFEEVIIRGQASDRYNKVCLFESGGSNEPFRTEYISEIDGTYSIHVYIPDDMREHKKYLYTDMRFWGDENDDGIRDSGEPISECHFIIWVPSAETIYLKVYQGPTYEFESDEMVYDYK